MKKVFTVQISRFKCSLLQFERLKLRLNCGEVLGKVEVQLPSGPRNSLDFGGVGADEVSCTAIAGAGEERGKELRGEDGGDACSSRIDRGGDGDAAGGLMVGQEGPQVVCG
jgi:hypothetical protein